MIFKELKFHSKVRKEYYNQLEKLFFFNDNQYRYYNRITEIVEKYGEPYIERKNNYITLKLEKIENKCLFVSKGPKLIGVVVYKINHLSKNILVIHLAFNFKSVSKNNKNTHGLIFKILKVLVEKISNELVKSVKILYINKEMKL